MKDDGRIDKRKDRGGPSQANKALLSSALVSDKKSAVKSMFELWLRHASTLSRFLHLNTECAPSEGYTFAGSQYYSRVQTARRPCASSIFMSCPSVCQVKSMNDLIAPLSRYLDNLFSRSLIRRSEIIPNKYMRHPTPLLIIDRSLWKPGYDCSILQYSSREPCAPICAFCAK